MKLNEIPEGDENKWVCKLTPEQKDQLVGQKYTTNSYFNPIQDGNEPANWIISIEEIKECNVVQFLWVKNLPLIEWVVPNYE